MSSPRDEIDGAGVVGTLTASDCEAWIAAGDSRTDAEKAEDAALAEWRKKSKSEKARIRREAERARIRRDMEANGERNRALDEADASGHPIPHSLREPLGRMIFAAARDYMKDPQHRADFEVWYAERYGRPYEWTRPGKEGTA